jgi:hypothetical protein
MLLKGSKMKYPQKVLIWVVIAIFFLMMMIATHLGKKHIARDDSFPSRARFGVIYFQGKELPYINIDQVSPNNKKFKAFISQQDKNKTLYVITNEGDVVDKVIIKDII